MKLLLDTHILLWWLAGHPSLSEAARRLIADQENAVFVSAVTLWEIWLKESLGKLTLPDDFETRLAEEAFESLPLLPEHTRELSRMPWHHRDPFDRMLIAQAQVAGLRLLTADEAAGLYGEVVLVAR